MSNPAPVHALNGVLRFDADLDTAHATLEELKATGRPFCWYTWPDQPLDGLETLLEQAGLRDAGGFTMVRAPISALPTGPAEGISWDVDWDAWARVLSIGHNIPAEHLPNLIRHQQSMDGHPDRHSLLGYDGDKPVATATLFTGTGCAGLYSGTVLPEARRQGWATRLMTAMADKAREMGLTEAVGSTTKDGYAFTMAHGFEDCGHFGQWVWDAGRPPAGSGASSD